mgnify:CR=1 FL=1
MYELKGLNDESIVVGAGAVEKLRAGRSVNRQLASAFRQVDVQRAKKPRRGEALPRVTVLVALHAILSLELPGEREPEVQDLVAAIERERGAS